MNANVTPNPALALPDARLEAALYDLAVPGSLDPGPLAAGFPLPAGFIFTDYLTASEGFLWFKDLSSPDPYGIMPVLGAAISLVNILTSSTSNLNPTMRKF